MLQAVEYRSIQLTAVLFPITDQTG